MALTVPPELEQQIAALAKDTGRSPKALTAEALRQYLAREEGIVAGIRKGLAQAELGDGTPHEDVFAKLEGKLRDKYGIEV